MLKYILTPFLLIIFVVGFGQTNNFNQLSSKAFKEQIDKGEITLLDVRTLSEFSNGHLEDAGQLNFYALDFKRKLLLLSENEPIYLYCNTGYRSKKAAEFLSENGYSQVYNLEHGIMEWNLEDLPVVVEPDAKPDKENKMESDEFYALINSEKPVFIDFYAPWCGPCRKMMPMVDSLKTKYKDTIITVKINADASKKLMKELEISSVPYLVLYQNGKLINSYNGLLNSEELLALLQIK